MKKASIDIGTNSVLLLVAEVNNGRIVVLEEQQQVPRLGKGVDKERNLHPESIERVVRVLKHYKRHIKEHYSGLFEKPTVTATSAVRDAANPDDFLSHVKTETGWNIRLLSGAEEAETTYRGALSVLDHTTVSGRNVILDIGGGSTEIAFGRGRTPEGGVSMDMGSVRFTERFCTADPPLPADIDRLRREVRRFYESHDKHIPYRSFDAIGVAGTVTSVAAIAMGLNVYDAEALNGYALEQNDLTELVNEFGSTSSADLERKYPVFLKGRGDVILTGTVILAEFLRWYGKDHLRVSTGGIRHGVLV